MSSLLCSLPLYCKSYYFHERPRYEVFDKFNNLAPMINSFAGLFRWVNFRWVISYKSFHFYKWSNWFWCCWVWWTVNKLFFEPFALDCVAERIVFLATGLVSWLHLDRSSVAKPFPFEVDFVQRINFLYHPFPIKHVLFLAPCKPVEPSIFWRCKRYQFLSSIDSNTLWSGDPVTNFELNANIQSEMIVSS